MERRRTVPPVDVHGTHHGVRLQNLAGVDRDLAQLVRVRAHDSIRDGEWRIRAEDELPDPNASFWSEAVGNDATETQLQRLALLLAPGQDDNLCERRIGELGRHREE